MKNLTNQVKAKLTKEEIDTYIKLQLAEEGHPLPYAEPQKPKQPEGLTEFDLDVLDVGGYFKVVYTEELEELFKEVLTKGRYLKPIIDNSYDTIGYEEMEEDHYAFPKINRRKSRSKAKIEANKEPFERYQKELEKYEKNHKEWKIVETQYQAVRADVLEDIEEAVSALQRKQTLKEIYQQYVSLANGDEAVAKNFFTRVYTTAELKEATE